MSPSTRTAPGSLADAASPAASPHPGVSAPARTNWLVIALAFTLNLLDGYDMVSLAFVAQPVAGHYGLGGAALGWLLSSALIGIAIGSLLIAPLADRVGRRRILLGGLALTLVGLVLTALAPAFAVLLGARLLTGAGVGTILAAITVVVSEFSAERTRGLAMSVYACSYGLGAAACGAIAKAYAPTHGWGIVFWVGAVLTTLALIATAILLPESPAFAAARTAGAAPATDSGEKNAASASTDGAGKPRLSDILTPTFLGTTLRLWAAFALITFAFTFASQWTPKLLTSTGLTAEQGIIGGIMLSFGGTIGSLIFGLLTTWVTPRRLLVAGAGASAAVLVGFISSTATPSLMFALGVGVGMFLNGCITGLYTVTPAAYPARLRTTGVGAAIGIGRAGAITAPILAGYLVDAGWQPAALYAGAAGATVLAALALVGIKRHGA